MPLLADNLAIHVVNWFIPQPPVRIAVVRRISHEPPVRRRRPAGDRLPRVESGGRVWTVADSGAGREPHPRDVVVYEALPNELPRVAGIISTVPQTPLTHVNLRAIQDGIPNAYIHRALDNSSISSFIGNYVHYTVTEDGWELSAATPEEVSQHYEAFPARPGPDAGTRPFGDVDHAPQSDRFRGLEGVRRQGGEHGRAGYAGIPGGDRPRRGLPSRSTSTTSS